MPHKNKDDYNKYMNDYYEKHRINLLFYLRRKFQFKKDFIRDYKIEKGCSICGENRAPCLEFHHSVGDKSFNVSYMLNRNFAMSRIMVELEKCVVYCSNCHRVMHISEENDYEQLNSRSKRMYRKRMFLQKYKADMGCSFCNERRSACLVFHHLGNKDDNISTMLVRNRAWKSIEVELKKCLVVCSNCHRLLHADELKGEI